MTLHVLLDLPSAEGLDTRLGPGDSILDLSLTSTPLPLRLHTNARNIDVTWIEHDLLTPDVFALARGAILRGLATLASQPLLEDGRTLRELFVVDGLSMWWHTTFSQRTVRTDPRHQSLYRQWWLSHTDAPSLIDRAAAPHDTWVLWARDPRAAHATTRSLSALCDLPSPAHTLTPDGAPHTPRTADPLRLDRWGRLKRHAAALRRGVRTRKTWRAAPRGGAPNASTDTELLVATYTNGWLHDADGNPRHTYFHEVAHTLSGRGVKVAWLPIATTYDTAERLATMLAAQDLPVVWDALDLSPGDVLGASTSLTKARRNLPKMVDTLRGHDALHLFGLDLSEWILTDLADLVDEDATKFLTTRHIVERASARLSPDVLLYRDEFYVLGRAVSSARLSGTRTWAMQHGLITEDHWTYLNPASDLTGPYPLPTPDAFLTYGDSTRALLSRWGAPEDLFVPLGSLRHDGIMARAANANPTPRADDLSGWLALSEDTSLVTICTQLVGQIPGWIERVVGGLRAAGLEGRAHLAIKQHPLHRAEDLIAQTFTRLGWGDYSVHVLHLDALLRHSDVVLMENSTTGIEALAWGTPIICINEPGRYESFPYVSDHGALDGSSIDQMAAALATVLDPHTRDGITSAGHDFLSSHFANTRRPALDTFEEMLRRALDS